MGHAREGVLGAFVLFLTRDPGFSVRPGTAWGALGPAQSDAKRTDSSLTSGCF